MWKVVDWATTECYLCPVCDSLGPHMVWPEEETDQSRLDCIDCGAALGYVTPLGLEPLDDERVLTYETPLGQTL